MRYNDCMGKRIKNTEKYAAYATFDELVRNEKIPQKKWQFFQNFINPKEQTFGNAVKSYHAAGYKENKTSRYLARDLYNSPLIQRMLTLYRHKQAQKRENADVTVFDKTDNDLLWALEEAKIRNDYAAVRAIAMDRAKLHGILVDRHQVIDPTTEQSINQTLKMEAAKMAENRLLAKGPAAEDTIDAEFTDQTEEKSTTDVYNDSIEAAIISA